MKAEILQSAVWHQFRRRLWERDGGLCGLCKQPVALTDIQIDHVQPRALGGSHDEANLQVSHALCNAQKGIGQPRRAYRDHLPRHPEASTSQSIRDWRATQRLSQPALARLLGVHEMTLSRWERGEREIPSYLHLALEALAARNQ